MLSCNTTSSIFQSLSTTSRYCLYKQALSLNGLIIKMNYQPINVKSMRSTTRNERTLEKMDCSECNQDIRENLLLKWNYQDLLKDIGKNLTLMSYDFDSDSEVSKYGSVWVVSSRCKSSFVCSQISKADCRNKNGDCSRFLRLLRIIF